MAFAYLCLLTLAWGEKGENATKAHEQEGKRSLGHVVRTNESQMSQRSEERAASGGRGRGVSLEQPRAMSRSFSFAAVRSCQGSESRSQGSTRLGWASSHSLNARDDTFNFGKYWIDQRRAREPGGVGLHVAQLGLWNAALG